MAGWLVMAGLFLLWGAATGRADALVTAIMNPSGLHQGGEPGGASGGDPNDPGGTILDPYWGGHVPYYPPSPTDPPSVPGWYESPGQPNPWDFREPNEIPLAPGWYIPR